MLFLQRAPARGAQAELDESGYQTIIHRQNIAFGPGRLFSIGFSGRKVGAQRDKTLRFDLLFSDEFLSIEAICRHGDRRQLRSVCRKGLTGERQDQDRVADMASSVPYPLKTARSRRRDQEGETPVAQFHRKNLTGEGGEGKAIGQPGETEAPECLL